MVTTNKIFVNRLFPRRNIWAHKGNAGKLLVIGGSQRYSGSPAFVAMAAIRSGTDLTLVAAPKRAADIIASLQPDLITESLHCEHLCPHDTSHLLMLADWADAVVIGGGLDIMEKTERTIKVLLRKIDKPCVIDAEALRAVSGESNLINETFILTPHENEFEALGGNKPSHKIKERISQTSRLSRKLGATILLKGNIDIIALRDRIAINKTGNPYMTKGGTGDVLAGICGSLLARKVEPFKAACAAAWINGTAGNMAVKKIGPGFFVSEMLDFIPKVIWR